MEFEAGYELTPIGQAFLETRPVGGCAPWVKPDARADWDADQRAREIAARHERNSGRPSPAA